jgi:hypothetical protein
VSTVDVHSVISTLAKIEKINVTVPVKIKLAFDGASKGFVVVC